MAENRNQQGQSDVLKTNTGQQGEGRNISDQDVNVENPQKGSQWENYQTRELSSNAQSGGKTNVAGGRGGSEKTSDRQDKGL